MGFDLGSILGGGLMSSAQALWDQKEKGRDREYETKMSNTAHQREVADLRAAGLNPILSAGGTGASVPNVTSKAAPGLGQNVAALTTATTGRKMATATVANTMAQADQNRVQAELDKGALELYNSSSKIKAAADAARLTQKSGGDKPINAAAAVYNSAKEAGKNLGKQGVDKLMLPVEQYQRKHQNQAVLDELNRKLRRN